MQNISMQNVYTTCKLTVLLSRSSVLRNKELQSVGVSWLDGRSAVRPKVSSETQSAENIGRVAATETTLNAESDSQRQFANLVLNVVKKVTLTN